MTDVTGSLKSSNMSKMNYFFPLLSFLLFLPTSVFSNQKHGTTLFPCPLHTTSLNPVCSLPKYLPKYPFLPLRALVQALIFHQSHSDFCFLILPDQICSATRAVIPKHKSGLTTSHLKIPQLCHMVSKVKSANQAFHDQVLPACLPPPSISFRWAITNCHPL